MTGYVSYNGIPCECAACSAKVVDHKARMHIRWSNGHGACIRVFCDACGLWTDYTMTGKRGLSFRVFKGAK